MMTMEKNSETAPDYHHVRATLNFISENWRNQPSLDEIAAAIGLSPAHLQRVFTRWAGISPKGFLQAVTLDHARAMLDQSASILDTAYEVGLSGPSRLHDLFVDHEGVSPGTYKAKGAGVTMRYGFQHSPFGPALIMVTDKGLSGLAFADEGGEEAAFEDMARRWPNAEFIEDSRLTSGYAARIFAPQNWQADEPLKVILIGTDFEIRVWETLLRIPPGRATTYSNIAEHIGKPKAARAVGAAVGRNPISFVVPCHRVIGKSGGLCGYHWGLTRKQAIIGWEAGLTGQPVG